VKCRNFIRGLPRSYARGLSDSRSTRMWNKRFGTPGVERLKSFCGALDEVRVRVREQLLPGATQIKLTAGGGVASPHSPLDVSTFTEAELRAAVEAAENWGTYVTVHAYTPISIQRAIAAGVKCIEHGHLMDEETKRLLS
jgi:imidazolonepropionase-like amidohydrolase